MKSLPDAAVPAVVVVVNVAVWPLIADRRSTKAQGAVPLLPSVTVQPLLSTESVGVASSSTIEIVPRASTSVPPLAADRSTWKFSLSSSMASPTTARVITALVAFAGIVSVPEPAV